MAYQPPAIGLAGLSIPSYNDILQSLLANFRSVYGQTVYLGNDSADFQFISILALVMSDNMQALQLEYNNRSPNFAIGAALDSLVKVNGLARKLATFSTCSVVITGVAGTVINNGVVQDVNGNQWTLPSIVVIGGGGTVTVTATATNTGSINALIGQIINIVTPTSGWTGVNNIVAASLGQPIETDAQLRLRQTVSAELPSSTLLAGTVAAIVATPGVTRYNVIENATAAVDVFGTPPHSITAVVEGGLDLAVATAIFNNRGIGCFTNGTTTVLVTDPHTGIISNISFYRPIYVPIYVILTVKMLAGYVPADTQFIQVAVVNYLNSLQIGESVVYSSLYGAALSVMPNPSLPLFSIHAIVAGTGPLPSGTVDIPINFNQVSQGLLGNIIVNVI